MSELRQLIARLPGARRFYRAVRYAPLVQRLSTPLPNREAGNIFFHYNSLFDAEAVIRRHAVPGLGGRGGYVTNFLGVLIEPRFFPAILAQRVGEVEALPIPANWHADIAEWAAALRAVDLARGSFTMLELGCGWGCWMCNTGVAARRAGLAIRLAGIEADAGHIAFAEAARVANGFSPDAFRVLRGVASAAEGIALFPRDPRPGHSWGSRPVFGASNQARQKAAAGGRFDEVPMIGLPGLLSTCSRLDLLHMDIQGGEADLIEACLEPLGEKVAYLVIGTHSREIEGRLFARLRASGWRLEIERPAILTLGRRGPSVTVDGLQGWRNRRLR
ncbi:MAG: hypothetical protein ACREFJ_09490 [Acetobacteraceae bacterium]